MRLVVIFLAMAALRLEALDVFSLELKRFPNPQRRCEGVAEDLAERFTQAAGVEPYSAGIVAESDAACDIRIAYLAETEVPTVQTVDVDRLATDLYGGVYPSREVCESRLDREKKLLEDQTGHEAWISYCYRDESLSGRHFYIPFVQAIGASERRLFRASSGVWVGPRSTWDELSRGVVEGFKAYPELTLASLSYDQRMLPDDRAMVLRYYSTSRLWLNVEGYAEHGNPEVCDAQINRLREKLAGAKRPPLYAYCGERAGERYQIGMISLLTDIVNAAPVKVSRDPKLFSSLRSCVDALDAVETFYREKLGRPVLGGFCADKGQFQITLFEERVR